LGGIKVAFLSDLHIKNIGLREKKVLEILGEEKPGLILLGGDYITFRGSYQPAISFLQELQANHGIYAVMGNTDYSNENGSCILCHKKKSKKLKDGSNLIFLRNFATPLQLNGKVLNLIGLDDPVNKKADLTAALQYRSTAAPQDGSKVAAPRSTPHAFHGSTLLLSHSPEVFKEAANCGIDFLLCGHTHGGQIFLTKYLRKFIHFGPAFKFPKGFYQDQKTLMYVGRGVGTSFLPFRLGVKPEITFFTFSNGLGPSKDSCKITDSTSKSIFSGITFSGFLDLFDFYPGRSLREVLSSDLQDSTPNIQNPKESLSLTPNASNALSSGPSSPDLTPYASNLKANDYSLSPKNDILFDFESDADLEKLNWKCHKWFERSREHATSGQYSLRVELPPGQCPGILFNGIKNDWSKNRYLKMDVFNPSDDKFIFHIRIDDQKSGWDYDKRFDYNFALKPGMNHLSIPTDSIKTNIKPRPLDLKNIKRFMAFIPINPHRREFYIDNIRLE